MRTLPVSVNSLSLLAIDDDMEGDDELTLVIDKLGVFAIMYHKQRVKPDHTERSGRDREDQHPPLIISLITV